MLCPSLTETTCSNLTTVFTSTGRISANVCVCRACLPQLEIAAERNLKNVCFFSPESYLVIIIGIQILLLFENGGKLTWIGFSLWRPRWTEWVLIPDDFWKKKENRYGGVPWCEPLKVNVRSFAMGRAIPALNTVSCREWEPLGATWFRMSKILACLFDSA